MTSPPPITAIVPYFGGKRSLAAEIVRRLGPHRAYWEPFCGSMAVLLAKPRSAMETVNDLNGDLINLARVIRDEFDGPRLYRRLRRSLCVEELHREAREKLATETDPFDRAYWYFLDSWLGRNGTVGTKSSNNGFCVRFTANGGSPSVRLSSAVESIPAWHRRMRRVMILRKDAFWLLDRIQDAPHTVVYVDSPYIVKGAKYLHDFEPVDHGRLAASLGRFQRAKVVVSYYEHPDLAGLYPPDGWERVPLAAVKGLSHAGRRGAVKVDAPEVLLVNRQALFAAPEG